MFNVLNTEGDIIKVDKINLSIHRHHSWREFTLEEIQVLNSRYKPIDEIEEARAKYETKYWKPVPIAFKNKLEWINSKNEMQL